jgi:hypothetical protein
LLAALAANTLVQAHMTHNRKPASKWMYVRMNVNEYMCL